MHSGISEVSISRELLTGHESMLGTLRRGTAGGGPPAGFEQDEISLPALEICLGEDHRIKTKTFQTAKKIILNVVSGICNPCNNVCNE